MASASKPFGCGTFRLRRESRNLGSWLVWLVQDVGELLLDPLQAPVGAMFFIAGEEYPLIVSKEENLLVNPLPCPPLLSLASPLPGSLDIPSVFP